MFFSGEEELVSENLVLLEAEKGASQENESPCESPLVLGGEQTGNPNRDLVQELLLKGPAEAAFGLNRVAKTPATQSS